MTDPVSPILLPPPPFRMLSTGDAINLFGYLIRERSRNAFEGIVVLLDLGSTTDCKIALA